MRWLDGITNAMDMKLGETVGDGDGQGVLACCGPWGRKESDKTEQLKKKKKTEQLNRTDPSVPKVQLF